MNAVQLNLLFAWLWIFLGFVSGTVLGLLFHRENWLGGYASFKRRMYRLGHISFFGLGVVNYLFASTARSFPACPLTSAASWALIVGGITMPLCCGLMAQAPKARMIFAVPVVSLLLGGALTLALLFHNSSPAGAVNPVTASAQPPTHYVP